MPLPPRSWRTFLNCTEFNGFSLQANTRVGEAAREQFERLCPYLCRPAISAGRVDYLDDGRVRIRLERGQRHPLASLRYMRCPWPRTRGSAARPSAAA